MEKIDTGTDQLLVEKENGVATIILNRPEARNALSTQLTPALRRMIAQMGEDREVGALLITGAGSASRDMCFSMMFLQFCKCQSKF